MTQPTKYSDQFVDWLIEEGYTHCFFVAGGNIMHILDSVRSRMTCVPFVHEVGAAIAAEYFTVAADTQTGKAFVLVTAGPGLTNTVTAIASAWMESRELLIVGGQVKRSDLGRGDVRQRGIQEVDGATLVASICKEVLRIETPAPKATVTQAIRRGCSGRKGPVFIEFCLDAQAGALVVEELVATSERISSLEPKATDVTETLALLAAAERPVILLGGGMDRQLVHELAPNLKRLGIPLMTTWNGADLVSSENPLYAGRPNTWGQRSANLLIQQADLVLALGTRLGLQQTGFAWEGFVPVGKLIHVDVDESELTKGHPHVDLPVQADANEFLALVAAQAPTKENWDEWREFVVRVRDLIPLNDPSNETAEGFVKPFEMLMELAERVGDSDVFVPSSSGGAFTVTMQSLQQRASQRIITNKGMASMGYGLSGAIGASLANRRARTFLIEGDGSFAQNLQELGTLSAQSLPVKILLFANDGYASIRMTQRNYFNGAWIGCDSSSGLGLPDWKILAASYGIPFARMTVENPFGGDVGMLLRADGPAFIEVPIDPEQTFFPKILSSIQPDGKMKSDPLHFMKPDLSVNLQTTLFKHMGRYSGSETK
jgi:acetolactate synthase-1/2/3 large subunit